MDNRYNSAKTIGWIKNYYGSLMVSEENGKFYWMIEDHSYDISDWEEIPEYLYKSLLRFETEGLAPVTNFESGIYNPDDGSITPVDINALAPEQKNYIERMAKLIFKKP